MASMTQPSPLNAQRSPWQERLEKKTGPHATAPQRLVALDAMLRQEYGRDQMSSEPIEEKREAVLMSSPWQSALEQVIGGVRPPRQAFLELVSACGLETLLGARRLMSEHLATARAWMSEGLDQEAAALLGLLTRAALAGGQERVVLRSALYLEAIYKRQPALASMALPAEELESILHAWQVSAQAPESRTRTLAHLAKLIRRRGEEGEEGATAESHAGDLGEVAVLERLLVVNATGLMDLSEGQRSRVMLRLMELYGSSPLGQAEWCLRGMTLVKQWAMACSRRDTMPRTLGEVTELALHFERRLRDAGYADSRTMLIAQLGEVLRILGRRWTRAPELARLHLVLGRQLRSELGSGSDRGLLAQTAWHFIEGERLALDQRTLCGQLREAALEVMTRWLLCGDPEAERAMERWKPMLREGGRLGEQIGYCELLLLQPTTPQRRLYNAHRCQKLAEQILGHPELELQPTCEAHALLLRSLAYMACHQQLQRRTFRNVLKWLRRGVALLMRQLKRSRPQRTQRLLGRTLLALGQAQLLEASHWQGTMRLQLLEQAERDTAHAQRLLENLGAWLEASEACWIQGKVWTQEAGLDQGAHRRRLCRGLEMARRGMALLDQAESPDARGDHTQGISLRNQLRHDIVQMASQLGRRPLAFRVIRNCLEHHLVSTLDGLTHSGSNPRNTVPMECTVSGRAPMALLV